jgi:hypothetical protein
MFYIQGYNIRWLHIIVTNNRIKYLCHRNLQPDEMLCASTVYIAPVLSSLILMLEEPEIRKRTGATMNLDAIRTTAVSMERTVLMTLNLQL